MPHRGTAAALRRAATLPRTPPAPYAGPVRHPRLLALAVAAVVVTGGGYTLVQPTLRPDLVGGSAGFTVAHVGSTYVCGNVLALADDDDRLEVVRASPLGIPREAADVRLVVTTSDSELFAVGALGLAQPPAYGDPGVAEPADFVLGRGASSGREVRVHLAVTPRRLGALELDSVEVTYRTSRWLPSSTVSVPSGCTLAVTATGPDPNIPA